MLKRLYASNNAKDKAANVIKTLFKIRAAVRSGGSANDQVVKNFVWLTKLKKNIAVFKNDSRYQKQKPICTSTYVYTIAREANSYNLQVDELLKNLKTKLDSDIGDIKREVVAIPLLEKKCHILEVFLVKL